MARLKPGKYRSVATRTNQRMATGKGHVYSSFGAKPPARSHACARPWHARRAQALRGHPPMTGNDAFCAGGALARRMPDLGRVVARARPCATAGGGGGGGGGGRRKRRGGRNQINAIQARQQVLAGPLYVGPLLRVASPGWRRRRRPLTAECCGMLVFHALQPERLQQRRHS
ncbi:unnamed protein product [Prorocentrum cordatum]|uniref:Uncharacterized protein n=1 Tax=Prorocentrum cordatum TaxID=2364126 RepID=A0ABN9PD94_9DINO|nr:unnamed protein product [Polarella glacialis]